MIQQNTTQSVLRVLVADDLEATRHTTCLMLKMTSGFDVAAVAQSGAEAVILAREHLPDIAIIDVNMDQEMDGLDAIEQITKENPRTKCIVISTERQPLTMQVAKQVGAFDYLIKPFTSDELVDALEKAAEALQNNPALKRRKRQTGQLRDRRDVHLVQIARECIKARRTDDETVEVLEELAKNPYCELNWLKSLAMIYVIRMDWNKLRKLARRLDEDW